MRTLPPPEQRTQKQQLERPEERASARVQAPVLVQTPARARVRSAREKLGQEVAWLLCLVEREQGPSQK